MTFTVLALGEWSVELVNESASSHLHFVFLLNSYPVLQERLNEPLFSHNKVRSKSYFVQQMSTRVSKLNWNGLIRAVIYGTVRLESF